MLTKSTAILNVKQYFELEPWSNSLMIYDTEKKVERRLSRRQVFRECPQLGHYNIPKDSLAQYCILCLNTRS